jgi:TonB family protein
MKYLASLIIALSLICLSGAAALAQAGRRTTSTPKATYTVPLPAEPAASNVHVERDSQDKTIYRCVVPSAADPATATAAEQIFHAKEVTTKARILSKPDPDYTLEARRNGTTGSVVLKAVLSSAGRVDSVQLVRELPDGLTESSVKAACLIRFEPALKDNKAVSQYVLVEYKFMADFRLGPRSRMPPIGPRP